MIEYIIIGLFIVGLSWVCGYNSGKKMMIKLFKSHLSLGYIMLEDAINYEEDIQNSVVPRNVRNPNAL